MKTYLRQMLNRVYTLQQIFVCVVYYMVFVP